MERSFDFYSGSPSAAVVLHDLELLHPDLYPCLRALLRDDDACGDHRLLVLATVNAASRSSLDSLDSLLEPFECIDAAMP